MNPTPTIEDRELANDALYRAVNTWAVNVKGRDAVMPLSCEHARKLVEGMPALAPLVVEMEIAIARARLQERDRCAALADAVVIDCKKTAPARTESWRLMNSTIEATAMTIATQIRTGTRT